MLEAQTRTTGHFRVLYRVFHLRIIDLDLLSADADTTKLLGQFAAILAAVSFALTAPLIVVGGLSQEALWTVEHFLIELTMVVVAAIAILSWESIFPTRLDLFVLGPLPVRPGVLTAAKLAALASALGLSVLALNVFTGLVWPILFSPVHSGFFGLIRAIGAYWVTVSAAAMFVFCCVLIVHGLGSQLLPRQHFLRLSSGIQVGLLALSCGTFILEPSLESKAALAAPASGASLAALPSYWFLGLFQSLNGSMDPVFLSLVRRAWTGLGIAAGGACFILLLAYTRSLQRILEEPEIVPRSGRLSRKLHAWALGSPPLALFSVRTICAAASTGCSW